MKRILLTILTLCFIFGVPVAAVKSTHRERKAIHQGNTYFKEGEYAKAQEEYSAALKDNPSSMYALFNLGVTQMKLAGVAGKDDKNASKAMEQGIENLRKVATCNGELAPIASLANYNLGNYSFRNNQLEEAINFYKQSLRLNPSDDNARRNLRIAQLKKQQQNKDKNKDKNKNKNDKNKDKDKNKDQNKDQNKDKNQNKDNKDNNKQNQPPQQKIDPQTADQILKATENKENATRARMQQRKQNQQPQRGRKNW